MKLNPLTWFRREKRNIQGNQAITLNDLLQLQTGQTSDAGVNVTHTSAMSYSAFFAAVRVVAESVALLPLKVYRRSEEAKEPATSHPAYSLLHDAPNEFMSAVTFKETLTGHAVTWGGGYAEIIWDGAGRPKEFFPLPPDRTDVVESSGKFRYTTTQPRRSILPAFGPQRFLYPDEVLHIRGLGFDGIKGYSVLECARNAIGLGIATEKFGGKFFANGAHLGAALEHPGKLSEPALKHLRTSLSNIHGGVENAHKPMILEEGMKWNAIGIPPGDAQMLESRKFQVSEIARMFRIPPHMLGDMERATFSNIEQQALEFVQYTLSIWLEKWAQECNRKLFTGRGYFCEFVLDSLLKGDTLTRYQVYSIARANGIMTTNEIRAKENMNPVEGGDDIKPAQAIYGDPKSDAPEPKKPGEPPMVMPDEDEEEDDDEMNAAHLALLESAIMRLVRKETDRAERAKQKKLVMDVWRTAYLRDERAHLLSVMREPIAVVAAAAGATPAALENTLALYCERHAADSMAQKPEATRAREAAQWIVEQFRSKP